MDHDDTSLTQSVAKRQLRRLVVPAHPLRTTPTHA